MTLLKPSSRATADTLPLTASRLKNSALSSGVCLRCVLRGRQPRLLHPGATAVRLNPDDQAAARTDPPRSINARNASLCSSVYFSPASPLPAAGVATTAGIQAGKGKLYLCAIKDVYSNRIVGYSITSRMKSRLAVNALDSAVARRVVGCIDHSDRGSQFRSRKFLRALSRRDLLGSMGRVAADAADWGRAVGVNSFRS